MDSTIVAIAGGKGGVGRTTTALNLGVALERAGVNAALVDADLAMTNLGEQLGVDPEPGVHGVLAGTDSINDAVVAGPAGLTVVPGDPSLDAFSAADEGRLDRVLAPLAAAHEVVLVDTAAGLTRTHRDVFDRADGVVLVTTPERTGQADAEKTRQVVDHLGTEILGAVVTAVEEPDEVEGVVDRLGVDAIGAIPYDDGFPAEPVAVGADRPAGQAYERAASALGVFHEIGAVDREAVALPQDADAADERLGAFSSAAEDEAAPQAAVTEGGASSPAQPGLTAVNPGELGERLRSVSADVERVAGRFREDQDDSADRQREDDRDPDLDSLHRLFDARDDGPEGAEGAGGTDSADEAAGTDGIRPRLKAVSRTVKERTAAVGEVTGSLRAAEGATEMRRDADREPDFDSLNRLFEEE